MCAIINSKIALKCAFQAAELLMFMSTCKHMHVLIAISNCKMALTEIKDFNYDCSFKYGQDCIYPKTN